MKNFKKIMLSALVIIAVGVTSVNAFAKSQYKNPAEVISGITGREVESVIQERRETNKTYGMIAKDNGKLEEFKKESLEMKKDNLNTQVEEGRITKEERDKIIKSIEEHQVNCDGERSERLGQKNNARFGFNKDREFRGNRQGGNRENKERLGNGHHGNRGLINSQRNGQGVRDSSCVDPIK